MDTSTLSIIISVISSILALVTYFKHDKKIKEQEHRINEQEIKINEYLLEKIEKERSKELMASLSGKVIRSSISSYTLCIQNKGFASAKNVRLEIKPETTIVEGKFTFPLTIKPQEKISVTLHNTNNFRPNKLMVTYSWDDDLANNRKESEELTISGSMFI